MMLITAYATRERLVDSDEWNTANASSATPSSWNYAKAVRKGGEHW